METSASSGEGPVCPKCGAKLSQPVGGKVACPACHASYRVQTKKPVPPPDSPKSDDDWFEQIKPLESPEQIERASQARLRAQPKIAAPAKPELNVVIPRLPMWQGVWTFPWYRSTFVIWLFASAMICVLGVIVGLFMLFLGLGTLFVAITAGTVGVSIFAYLVGLFGLTVIETANGVEWIEDWPFFDRTAILDNLRVPGIALAYVSLLCYAVSLIFPEWEWDWLSLLSIFIMLFPLTLLSMLEADSIFVPISPAILKTIWAIPAQWVLFLVQSTLLFFLLLGSSVLAGLWAGQYFLLPLGPIMAAGFFIYGRLIGRIAWCGGQATAVEREEIDYRQIRTQDPSVQPNRSTHADPS